MEWPAAIHEARFDPMRVEPTTTLGPRKMDRCRLTSSATASAGAQTAPRGARKRGGHAMAMRLDIPTPEALDGRWAPPDVQPGEEPCGSEHLGIKQDQTMSTY